jgi:hypothetical protein
VSAPQPPAARPARGRYTWFLGVVAFLLIVWVTLNSVTNEGVRSGGPEPQGRLVWFAVPDADAPPRDDEDANVDQDSVCRVRGRGILNICELAREVPLVLALFPSDAKRCKGVMDQFQRLAPQLTAASFVAVGSRGDRNDLLDRRWGFRVGWDKDGAVASVYGLVGCPQVTFAHRGGRVLRTTRQEISDRTMAGLVRRLRG